MMTKRGSFESFRVEFEIRGGKTRKENRKPYRQIIAPCNGG